MSALDEDRAASAMRYELCGCGLDGLGRADLPAAEKGFQLWQVGRHEITLRKEVALEQGDRILVQETRTAGGNHDGITNNGGIAGGELGEERRYLANDVARAEHAKLDCARQEVISQRLERRAEELQ